MARKIALIGTATSQKAAPFDDPSYEIWGVSARGACATRATRWFELHRLDGEPQDWANKWRGQIRSWSHDVDLYMIYPEPDLGPSVIQYPVDSMCARFGTFFMTSTFSWMMAIAIDEIAPIGQMAEPGSEIAIFGVDMEAGTEYSQQRAGLRHFMELAKALGIAVSRLADGGLAYDPVPYPMWQDDPLLSKLSLRQGESESSYTTFTSTIRLTREMIAATKGALDEINEMTRPRPVLEGEDTQPKPYDPDERFTLLEKKLNDLMETSAATSKHLVAAEAIASEQNWLRHYLMP